MDEIEVIFRNDYLFSREDLISVIKQQLEHLDTNEDGDAPGYIENNKKLYYKFLEKIKKAHLPELNELYWFYDYLYTGRALELYLCEGKDIELDEDKEYISSMTIEQERTLLSIPDVYVNPEEFAKIHNVKSLTVQQWINRGKLKYAKYDTGQWMIPSTNARPGRYDHASYIIDPDDGPQIDEFPTASMCQDISIWKDNNHKGKYEAWFTNYKMGMQDKFSMTKEEIELLEYELIKSGKATCEPPCQIHFYPKQHTED